MLHGMDGTALFQIPEMTVSGLYAKKTPRRFCRTDNHLGKGKHDADQNTIDGSKQQHSKKCTKKDQTFCAADFPQTDCKFKFRGSKQCGDHNRGKHRNRKKSDKFCSAQKQNHHGNSRHNSCQLGFPLILFSHCGP